ncbi:hypothetical protein [Cupriavidus sp. CuC1]|uniref:hypothetical protein n=1 Tax=Cupriavidus sp. CuC1 TaxID=3373131 RepID=UPI0037CE77C8
MSTGSALLNEVGTFISAQQRNSAKLEALHAEIASGISRGEPKPAAEVFARLVSKYPEAERLFTKHFVLPDENAKRE